MDHRRRGEVPTPRPLSGSTKPTRSGQNERMKRLNNANAPVNTLDGPTAANARHAPRTSFSSLDGTLAGGSKRRPDRDGESTYGYRDPKRLRPNAAPSRDAVRLPQDNGNDTESVSKSTVSNDDRQPKKATQARQSEFRTCSVAPPTPRRRRKKKRPSAGAREQRSSVGVHRSSESPRSASPDELQNSSPLRVESDLLPPKPATSSKPSRTAPASTQFPFEAASHLRKHRKNVVHEDISDDELASSSSKQRARTRPQSFSKFTKSQPTPPTSKIQLHQAVSGTHAFLPEKIVELVRNDSRGVWKLVTEDGRRIGHPWLQIDVERMHKIHHSQDSEIVEVYRPQAKNSPSTLFLQFEHKQASRQFILEVENAGAPVKLEEKPPDLLTRVYTRALIAARQSGSREERPDHSTAAEGLESEGVDCASSPLGEDNQRSKPAKSRLIDNLLPSTRQNSTSKRSSSPPSKPLATTRPRRVTRQSVSENLFEDYDDSFLPRWSLENTTWEKDWDRELVYPSTGRNRATVHKEDIHRLDEGAFLNDSLVFCYLRYLQVEMERDRPGLAKRIYFMNTYFFEILRKAKGALINYEGVKSWTSKIDIFSYDYIVVPVNEEAHWYLAIICNPRVIIEGTHDTDDDVVLLDSHQETLREPLASPKTRRKNETGRHSSPPLPTKSPQARERGQVGSARKADSKDFRIITLDSLGAPHSKTCQMLRKYLVEEAKSRKDLDALELDRKIGLTAKNIPGQDNFCDCGVFLLGYAQHFLKDPDGFVETILQRGKPEWTVDASELRNQVREILFRLHREYRKEVADRKKNSRKKKLEERAQKTSATGSSDDPVPEGHDRRSPVFGVQDPSPKPQLTGDGDAPSTPAREQAGGGGSAGPSSVSQEAKGRTSPRATPLSTAPSEKGRAMSSPQTDAQDQDAGSDSTNIGPDVKHLMGTTKIRQSIEHDGDQSTSTPHNSSSSPDLSSTREPVDDMVHSPAVPSPHEVATYDVPESPLAPLKPSIEKAAEPRFVKRLSSSPRSTRSARSPTLGEKSPSKRKVINIDDDEPQQPLKRVREIGKKSKFFQNKVVATDEEWRYVSKGQNYETRGFELKEDPGHGGTSRRGQGRRSSDAIDLTGKDHG